MCRIYYSAHSDYASSSGSLRFSRMDRICPNEKKNLSICAITLSPSLHRAFDCVCLRLSDRPSPVRSQHSQLLWCIVMIIVLAFFIFFSKTVCYAVHGQATDGKGWSDKRDQSRSNALCREGLMPVRPTYHNTFRELSVKTKETAQLKLSDG